MGSKTWIGEKDVTKTEDQLKLVDSITKANKYKMVSVLVEISGQKKCSLTIGIL